MKYILILLATFLGIMLSLSLYSRKKPESLGVKEGRLYDCPESHNCVSSQALNSPHFITPLLMEGNSDEEMMRLRSVIERMGGVIVDELKGEYIRAEFTSSLWRFVDDLECFYENKQHVVHVRSASRVGYYDFDSNRKRVEMLRIQIKQQPQ